MSFPHKDISVYLWHFTFYSTFRITYNRDLRCSYITSPGYFARDDIGYDIGTNQGKAFSYFTNGVACSVVEIDCLTGDHRVLKTDIVMDVGKSINPAIDVGQIEGAFVQGYGLYVMEQMVHSPSGVPLTLGPGAYKIPGFDDIPAEFNVTLLKG